MKKIVCLALMLLAYSLSYAQYTMVVTKTDGTKVEIETSQISQVSFREGGINNDISDFSIIGTWQGSYYFNMGNTTIVYDFKPDGNYTRERFSSINPTKKTYGKYSYANETLILNEWSDKEGYATFEQKIKVISSTEWQTIQTDAEIEMGFPAITFKKI